MPSKRGSANKHAQKKSPASFDKALPKKPKRASSKKTSFSYVTKSGATEVIILRRKNKYHEILLRAFDLGLHSDWFHGLADITQHAYHQDTKFFFNWINESNERTNSKTQFKLLKNYEVHKLNHEGLKRTPLAYLKKILAEGAICKSFTESEYDYLQTLIALTKPKPNPPTKPNSLSNWFDLPWLRPIIGESNYLQLESPRLLINSFRVTVSATLNYLLDQREQRQSSPNIEYLDKENSWYHDWNRLTLEQLGCFNNEGEPNDDLSALLLLDFVKSHAQTTMKKEIAEYGVHNLPHYPKDAKSKGAHPWQRPVIFHPDYQVSYSPIEELLCGWLAACEAIQPSDIKKLKINNYAIERNRSGRLLAMQCNYYKGRSGSFHKPAILMGNDIWTQTLDRYIQGLQGTNLFCTAIQSQKHLVYSSTKNSDIKFLNNVWKLPRFQQYLKPKLKLANVDTLFLDSILAIEQGNEPYHIFNSKQKLSLQEYETKISRPIPTHIFSASHIKTTTVHARSDNYRESDLVNHSSHTSLTENANYLTDENKEWVNQAGRITRIVLHDLQNVIHNPSITAIQQSTRDKSLRTSVVEATGAKEVTTHSLRSNHIQTENESEILVLDTVDTALYFIHYLTQAESKIKELVAVRPDWVERTLIVQVEWMEDTLSRMNSSSEAKKAYAKYATHLPQLFDHLLETTE